MPVSHANHISSCFHKTKKANLKIDYVPTFTKVTTSRNMLLSSDNHTIDMLHITIPGKILN